MELYNSSKYMRYLIHLFHDWLLAPSSPCLTKSSPSLPYSRASSKPVTPRAQALPLTRFPSWLPQSAFWPLLSASALSVPIRMLNAPISAPKTPSIIAFGQGDLSWKPGHLRSAYGAICCHKFKPKNMTDDIFLAQILGHKLLGPNASLSVGQSYKDFYVVGA